MSLDVEAPAGPGPFAGAVKDRTSGLGRRVGTGFVFGVDKPAVATMLRELANDIDAGLVVPTGASQIADAQPDDFHTVSLVLSYAEKVPAAGGVGLPSDLDLSPLNVVAAGVVHTFTVKGGKEMAEKLTAATEEIRRWIRQELARNPRALRQ